MSIDVRGVAGEPTLLAYVLRHMRAALAKHPITPVTVRGEEVPIEPPAYGIMSERPPARGDRAARRATGDLVGRREENVMAARRNPLRPARSPKAGAPPAELIAAPRLRRRQKTAHIRLRKDTMLLQLEPGPRAGRGAKAPTVKKR